LGHVDPHSVTESAGAGSHTQIFPTHLCGWYFRSFGVGVFTPPEASRRDEEHCAECGCPKGQGVRFTKPCGTAVASVHKGVWRRPVLCGRPVACGDTSHQEGDKMRVLSHHVGPVESMAQREKQRFELSLAITVSEKSVGWLLRTVERSVQGKNLCGDMPWVDPRTVTHKSHHKTMSMCVVFGVLRNPHTSLLPFHMANCRLRPPPPVSLSHCAPPTSRGRACVAPPRAPV